jgi:hypothetical protein
MNTVSRLADIHNTEVHTRSLEHDTIPDALDFGESVKFGNVSPIILGNYLMTRTVQSCPIKDRTKSITTKFATNNVQNLLIYRDGPSPNCKYTERFTNRTRVTASWSQYGLIGKLN